MSTVVADLAAIGIDRDLSKVKKLGGVTGIVKLLNSDLKKGLTDATVIKNRETYGANRLPPKATRGFWDHLVDALEDETLRILVFSAICSMAFGVILSDNQADIIQGFAILFAVVVVSGINSFQNWSKDREFRSLAEYKADRKVQVVRNGVPTTVSVFDLVAGDILLVPTGDMIPADGILIEGFDVEVDQSSLTGESELIVKEIDDDNLLLSSTKISNGSDVKMLITSVGASTQIGKAFSTIQEEEDKPTPLQEKLTELADQIGRIGTAAGVLTFTVLTILWLWHNPFPDYWTLLRSDFPALVRFFIVGVAIVVVAVPEGLPLAVTISLAFSMRRMMADMNMVRELQACETMGSATVIASDKTGTLTANRMSVVEAYVYGHHVSQISHGGLERNLSSPGALLRLAKAISLNSSASLSHGRGDRITFEGSPTEGALLYMLKENGIDYTEIRNSNPSPLARRAFRKELKYQSTVVSADAGGPDAPVALVYVTGAPEVVLSRCVDYMAADGSHTPLTTDRRFNLREEQASMARRGLRVLAIAFRYVSPGAKGAKGEDFRARLDQDLEEKLTLLGLFGLQDPLREGVPEAVQRCQAAGVRVMMVTGDNRDTAEAIAREAGILSVGPDLDGLQGPFPSVMDGAAFRELSEEEKVVCARGLRVLARCSPADKHSLVVALRAGGDVVAVTGDGTNDAPALRAADVGLSMGIAGTEVAKEASHIVILDDNFASIVATIRWGRSIKQGIRKFLNFQLTINIVALTLTFVTACMNKGSTEAFPIKPVQLLWINLIMDSFAALMLATEPPSDKLMSYAPQGKEEPLMTPVMIKNMVGHALFQTVLLLWLTNTQSGSSFFQLDYSNLSLAEHAIMQRREDTLVFNTFVFLQVFNLFNCRAVHDEWNILEGFSGSVIAQAILALIIVLQVVIVTVGGDIMQTTPLSEEEWIKCIFLGALSIPVGYLLKLVPASQKALAGPEPISSGRYRRAQIAAATPDFVAQTGHLPEGGLKPASEASEDEPEGKVISRQSSGGSHSSTKKARAGSNTPSNVRRR